VLEFNVEQDLLSEIVLPKVLKLVFPLSALKPENELQKEPKDCSQTVIDLVLRPLTEPVAPVGPWNPCGPCGP
jgi:hypothetical protein